MRKLLVITTISLLLASCASSNKEPSKEQKQAGIYYSHGTANLVRKQYTDALKYLREAYKLDPTQSKISNNLGMAYYFKKRPEKAIQFLKQALKLDPKNSDARNNLASIYVNQKDFDKAEKQYLIVLDDLIYPFQFRTYSNLGIIYKEKGMNETAVEHFKLALQENPNFCPAYYNLGMIERSRKNLNGALTYFKDGIKGDCYTNPAPHFQIAKIYLDQKKYTNARYHLELIKDKFNTSHYAPLATKKLQLIAKLGKNVHENTLSKNELKYKMKLIEDSLNEKDKSEEKLELSSPSF